MTLLVFLISFKGYQNQELYKTSSKTNLEYRSLIETSVSDNEYTVFFRFPDSYLKIYLSCFPTTVTVIGRKCFKIRRMNCFSELIRY
jgi:hypothetical protein